MPSSGKMDIISYGDVVMWEIMLKWTHAVN